MTSIGFQKWHGGHVNEVEIIILKLTQQETMGRAVKCTVDHMYATE